MAAAAAASTPDLSVVGSARAVVLAKSPALEEENPYLRLREQKIARNNARLKSLGLLKPTRKSTRRMTVAALSSSKVSKRQRPERSSDPHLPVRRSARRAGKEAPNYKDWADTNSRAERQQKPKKASARLLESNEYAEGGEDNYGNIAPRKSAGETKLSTKISTRNTLASVDSIVRRFLGKELERTGKAAVIDAALEASSSSDGVPEYNVSFNKYSGICEWQNDAIFLWVNIGSPHADVVNEFVDGGQRMTWFGGSRMHDGTPSIRNLIRVGRKARDGNLTKEDGIILWVRQYLPERRNFTPYVCLGRCSYGNHVAGTKPMEFVLNILDCDALKKREKKTGTFFFHDMIAGN